MLALKATEYAMVFVSFLAPTAVGSGATPSPGSCGNYPDRGGLLDDAVAITASQTLDRHDGEHGLHVVDSDRVRVAKARRVSLVHEFEREGEIVALKLEVAFERSSLRVREDGPPRVGERIAVVGYGPDGHLAWMPGRIVEVAEDGRMYYDASTATGCSGAPVFALDGEGPDVIGIHLGVTSPREVGVGYWDLSAAKEASARASTARGRGSGHEVALDEPRTQSGLAATLLFGPDERPLSKDDLLGLTMPTVSVRVAGIPTATALIIDQNFALTATTVVQQSMHRGKFELVGVEAERSPHPSNPSRARGFVALGSLSLLALTRLPTNTYATPILSVQPEVGEAVRLITHREGRQHLAEGRILDASGGVFHHDAPTGPESVGAPVFFYREGWEPGGLHLGFEGGANLARVFPRELLERVSHEATLARLRNMVRGDAHVGFITGARGSGKSWLLRNFAAGLGRENVVVLALMHRDQSAAALADAVWESLVKQSVSYGYSETTDELERNARPKVVDDFESERLFEAIASLANRTNKTVWLLFDDCQYAEPGVLRVIRDLVDRASPRDLQVRVVVVNAPRGWPESLCGPAVLVDLGEGGLVPLADGDDAGV